MTIEDSVIFADDADFDEDRREIGICQTCGRYDYMTMINGDRRFCFMTESCKEVGGGDIL